MKIKVKIRIKQCVQKCCPYPVLYFPGCLFRPCRVSVSLTVCVDLELKERIECLDGIVDKMADESSKSDEIDTCIAYAVCMQ